jgi:glutamate-1-semialdehyde 2,1-aminomutase/spore coat polysaccharide biosynthesis protein SpsF
LAELVHPFIYNELGSLETIFQQYPEDIAAVIMEPVGTIAPQSNFLQQVKDLCKRYGALLIFDEVITGFRWALGGAQEYFQVVPDLACFGKSVANGMPLAAVVGSREVMSISEDVFFSLTFGGECLSLASAMATISEIRDKGVIEYSWRQGRMLQEGFNKLSQEYGLSENVRCVGYPVRSVVQFETNHSTSLLLKTLFQQEVIKRGVLFAGYHNISFSHSDADIQETLVAYEQALQYIQSAMGKGRLEDALEGTVVQNVFRPV